MSAPQIIWSPSEGTASTDVCGSQNTPSQKHISPLTGLAVPPPEKSFLPLLVIEWPHNPAGHERTVWGCMACHASSPQGVRHSALRSWGQMTAPPPHPLPSQSSPIQTAHPVTFMSRALGETEACRPAPPRRPQARDQGPGTLCLCEGLLGSGRLFPDGTSTANVSFKRPRPVSLCHPRTKHPRRPLLRWRRQVQSSKAPRLTSCGIASQGSVGAQGGSDLHPHKAKPPPPHRRGHLRRPGEGSAAGDGMWGSPEVGW